MSVLAEKTVAPASPPSLPPEKPEPLNLSRRPFTNTRPVTRVALLLWLFGLLLLFGNVSLFWGYLSGSTEKRAQLARMEGQVEQERQAVAQLEARLASSDLDRRNKQVRFLNRKIAERTFSWSLLFDRVSEVLPSGVRLTRLTPSGLVDEKEAAQLEAQTRPRENRVQLTIAGIAKSDEAVLQFVDNLFAHPAFEDADISHDSREDADNLVRFDIRAMYLPAGHPHAAVVVEEQPDGPAAPPLPGKPAVKPKASAGLSRSQPPPEIE